MKKFLILWLNQYWYRTKKPCFLLRPLAWVYFFCQQIDKLIKKPQKTRLPVIVVGNLTVGGTGKTPIVLAIYEYLTMQGKRVGIITRAYKNKLHNDVYLVQKHDLASKIGDEAAMLAQKITAPIVISTNRAQAAEFLAQHDLCDIIISDDGLQHYSLASKINIAVIDGARGFGNQSLLPIGPLREHKSRLNSVDFILINGPISPQLSKQLNNYQEKTYSFVIKAQPLPPLERPVAAFAGIGNPENFFRTLREQNLEFKAYPFPDHHQYAQKDFEITENSIIMTEKDAIKCHAINHKKIYALAIEASIPDSFWQSFLKCMSLPS